MLWSNRHEAAAVKRQAAVEMDRATAAHRALIDRPECRTDHCLVDDGVGIEEREQIATRLACSGW